MDKRLCVLFFLILALMVTGESRSAQEAIFGLELVKIDNVFDPNAKPEHLLLVSGSLKLVGGQQRGNVWQAVMSIPQRAAAPKTDYGVFSTVGNRMRFYSLVTFSVFTGTIRGDRIVIQKFNTIGQSQTETWYLVR